MAATAGPNIVDNGLVLALDAADFNSFRGEATTNELVAVNWAGDGANQTSFTKGTVSVTDEVLKYKGYETYLWSPGENLNCYLYSTSLSTLRTSTIWTFSCYVKREDGAAITSLNVYMYYPNSDGSAAGTIENVGNGWYRVSRTRTGTDNYLSLVGFTGFAANTKYYLSGAQLEKKSYATTVTTANTTRGTTVATGGGWADLTGRGNNGELLNGVRESNTNRGELFFDGTNDYVNIGVGKGVNQFSGDFAVSAWVMRTSGGGTWGNIIGDYYTNTVATTNEWQILMNTSANFSLYRVGSGFVIGPVASGYSLDQWINIVVSRIGSTITMYANGNSIGTATNSTTFGTATGNFNIGIDGNNSSEPFSGRIANVMIYKDRGLTATEIQQNFNETRSRFGI